VLRAFQSRKAFTGSGQEFVNQAFITKLNPAGNALVYSSYLGGPSCLGPGVSSCLPNGDDDAALAIAVDAAGSAYLAGRARSVSFPQIEPIQPNANVYGESIPFIAKVQDQFFGAVRLYSVTLGTKDTTVADGGATGVAVDAAGNVYIAGFVVNAFPTTPGAFQATPASPGAFGGYGVIFKIVPGKYTTQVSVSNSQPTSADTVTVIASIKSAVPGGTVTFTDNGNFLGAASVSTGTASFATIFPTGVHVLTATYSGDNKVSLPVYLPVRQATN